MALGLGVLRLSPTEFWAMTPRELAAALRGALGRLIPGPAIDRAGLARLMSRFPDEPRAGAIS
jgi:uncharacterized phage protein (TIGR02216 family)